ADPQEPSDEMVQEELFNELDGKLAKLPAAQRSAFILFEFEGLPYKEIAQIEGVRMGTIKSRINRAKKKLRAVWNNYG
ncbi:MAG: RNA polymerase sigma factor, partial [Planctomycetota bacterium]